MKVPPAPSASEPLESTIQTYLIQRLKNSGYYYQKIVGQSRNGIPDILTISPYGTVWFLEVKREQGEWPEVEQREARRLQLNNANVAILWGKQGVDQWFTQWVIHNTNPAYNQIRHYGKS